MLWELIFYKTPDAAHVDCFRVGYFTSLEKVETVKTQYTECLPGFRDHPDGTWELIGHAVAVEGNACFWQAIGYSWSENMDERDLLWSPIFPDRHQAEECLAALQAMYQRDDWVINCIKPDAPLWKEGFTSE